MRSTLSLDTAAEQAVIQHFDATANSWDDMYIGPRENVPGVRTAVYRSRHDAVLNWALNLELPRGARVLEIGCGAGHLASALARAGYMVDAVDNSPAMIQLAEARFRNESDINQPSFQVADATTLPFPSDSFDLVISVGLLPWAPQPEQVIAEIRRVTRPGATTIVTSTNQFGLPYLLDPSLNLLLRPVARRASRWIAERTNRPRIPKMTWHRNSAINRMLSSEGLVPQRWTTVGFGPFTFCGFFFRPEPLATNIHRRLQGIAARDVPVVRSLGMSYIVLAVKKPEASPA